LCIFTAALLTLLIKVENKRLDAEEFLPEKVENTSPKQQG